MIKAVLCDLDGLLADTEILHCQAYQGAFRDAGFELSEDTYSDHWIRAGLGVTEYVAAQRLECDPSRLRQQKVSLYRSLVEACVQPMPGAVDLLDRLKGRKRLALASSGHRDDVQAVVDRLGLADYFETIVTAQDVERLKPFPDIFLCAAARLHVEPAQCVVLEDAEKGVLAARAAGMKVIAVPTRQTSSNDFSSATLIVRSLHEVTLEVIQSMG